MTPLAQKSRYNWTFWRVVWATLVLAVVSLGFWLFYRFNQVFFILFTAVVIGTVLRPPVVALNRLGLPRKAGVILIYLLLLALLTGFVLLLFPLIIEQSTTIAAAVPGNYQSLHAWIVDNPNPIVKNLSVLLPNTFGQPDPAQQTGQALLDSTGQVLGYVASAANGVFTVVAIFLLAYYWTLDGPRLIRAALLLAPAAKRAGIRELVSTIEGKVGAYIAGQGVLMLAVGSMALIAYWLIGLPYVLVLALVAGVMEAVPIIGPLLGAIPAALVASTLGPDKLVWVFAVTIIIQQLENSILVPRIMRKAVGVNPFVTLLALFAFGSLLGIAGSLMAIPLAAVIQILLNRFVFDPEAAEPTTASARGSDSRLRYEAQALAQDLRNQARITQAGTVQGVKERDQVLDEIEAIATDLDLLLSRRGQVE